MSTTIDLVAAVKKELKAAQLTYADLAQTMGMAESSVKRMLAPLFMERLQRVAQDFAQQHQTDQKLADKDREGYTLVLAMRRWEFEAFAQLSNCASR